MTEPTQMELLLRPPGQCPLVGEELEPLNLHTGHPIVQVMSNCDVKVMPQSHRFLHYAKQDEDDEKEIVPKLIVGCVQGLTMWDSNVFKVVNVYVAPSHRRQHVFRRLAEAVEKRFIKGNVAMPNEQSDDFKVALDAIQRLDIWQPKFLAYNNDQGLRYLSADMHKAWTRARGFYCNFCGRDIAVGEKYRVIYTNDDRSASGNPIVGTCCDKPNEDLYAEWRRMADLAKMKFRAFTEGR